MQSLQIFSSNRVERLYEGLKAALYQQGSAPFIQRLVVVPSPAMKNWLLLRLASDPINPIAAGCEICYLDQALERISQRIDSAKKGSKRDSVPKEMDLALLLESQITQIIRNRHLFDEQENLLWEPLLRYLKVNDDHEDYFQQRLISLSSRLAKVFLQYGRYGSKMLDRWEQSSHSKKWQEELWARIKRQLPHLQLPYQFLPTLIEENQTPIPHLQLHLFAMSFIPAQVYRFLSSSAEFFPIYYYLLSPCQVFWSDLCSDREKTKIQRYWREKGISKPQQQALDTFLRERNTLLANFGRMGREISQQIESHSYQIEECYHLPVAALKMPQYTEDLPPDTLFDIPEEPFSLLHGLHSDILLLRNPDSSEKIELSNEDHSIQLHSSYTKHREVEALYNTLVHLLTKHANDASPMTPSDIIVMVPDLAAYEATICHIFGAENSLLDFQIMEMRVLAKNSLIQGFLHLLSIPSSRWEAETILQLLEYPEFLRKHRFSSIDAQQIRSWMELSSINWGQNNAHRNALLESDYGDCQLLDNNPAGTWDYSISRLLMAIAIEPAGLDASNHSFVPPIEEMESSQSELLSKWILLIRTLQGDLQSLSSNLKMNLLEWSTHLSNLKERYFQIELSQKEAVATNNALISHLQKLANATSFTNDETFNFTSVYFHLKKSLTEEISPYRESHLHSVRFCSLLPMRALPAKVIALIGLDEGVFPRSEIPFSLNEMASQRDSDYYPSQTDFDRYLFLEALLSSRRYFLLSYIGYSFEEQREMPPSLLVQELFGYLDSSYKIDGKAPSDYCLQKHPFDAFDQSYFNKNALFPSYSKEHYQQAKAYLQEKKTDTHRFVHDFSIGAATSISGDVTLNIQDLGTFASNPLKAYFNKTLRIYLGKWGQNAIQNQEPFELSSLDKYQLRMQALRLPVNRLLNKEEKKGTLPRGLFKRISSESITSEIKLMLQCLSDQGVAPHAILPLHFSTHCEHPVFNENEGWTLPPIKLEMPNGFTVKLVGTLKEVSAQGLIFHQNRTLSNILKKWPHSLLLSIAIDQYQLPIQPQLISSKSSKPFAFPQHQAYVQLKKYLIYYYLGMSSPSPLIPEWVPDFLKSDSDLFMKNMSSSLESSFTSLYNDYALWLFRDKQSILTVQELYDRWQPLSIELFGELAQSLK